MLTSIVTKTFHVTVKYLQTSWLERKAPVQQISNAKLNPSKLNHANYCSSVCTTTVSYSIRGSSGKGKYM